jgi:hypothetical protein
MKTDLQYAEKYWPQTPTYLDEAELENVIYTHLNAMGYGGKTERQVACPAGVIDLLNGEAIYEVKLELSRPQLFAAIGQVSIYRQAINPNLKAVVVGLAHPDHRVNFIAESAANLNIEIWFLKYQDLHPDALQRWRLYFSEKPIADRQTQKLLEWFRTLTREEIRHYIETDRAAEFDERLKLAGAAAFGLLDEFRDRAKFLAGDESGTEL